MEYGLRSGVRTGVIQISIVSHIDSMFIIPTINVSDSNMLNREAKPSAPSLLVQLSQQWFKIGSAYCLLSCISKQLSRHRTKAYL